MNVELALQYFYSLPETSHEVDENQIFFRDGSNREWQVVIDAVNVNRGGTKEIDGPVFH